MNFEQQKAFDLVKNGKHVFISGSAGTGKSYTLDKIVEWHKSNNINIGVTSSTGISALNIKGRTLHSYLGIGLARGTAYNLYANCKKYKPTITKLQVLKVLIIDEISMISAELLDKVSDYLQLVRRDTKHAFGGVQMVFCGDLFQLPPIGGEFCFHSDVWKLLDIKICLLKTIVRQKDDVVFQKILENVKLGICSDEHLKLLNAQRYQTFGEINPTILYSKNVNVDAINKQEYNKLTTKEYIFKTIYSTNKNTKHWADSMNIPDEVCLKEGTQVMLTVNLSIEDGYANGTRGMVTGFTDDGPIILLKDGTQLMIVPWLYTEDDKMADDSIWVSCIPLKLAYALTIHKSQSATLDAATIDIGPSVFEYGQAYTALSRVRDLKSVKILNVSKKAFKTHPDVLEYYKAVKSEKVDVDDDIVDD
jgi:ATP-dependent exoDNAse (exonuclease V) alpha subunit